MKTVFLGSKKLGLEILSRIYQDSTAEWVVIHPDDSDDPRSNLDEFLTFTKEKNIPFYLVSNNRDAQNILLEIKPQLGLVCGWYWLISDAILETIPGGLWGIHNSLLPKYRGGSPLVWSIINGEQIVGSSVFKLTKGMDDGDILHQVEVFLESESNIQYALSEIEKKLLDTLPEKWNLLLARKAILTAQNHQEATYCGSRIPSDGQIDWSWCSERIHNFVRAQSAPYPGAFTFENDRKIIIEKTKVHNGIYYGSPGQIFIKNGGVVIVACGGNTALEVMEVEVDEKMIGAASAFKSSKQRLK
jgi:methionyl-tRNA formyltransferase